MDGREIDQIVALEMTTLIPGITTDEIGVAIRRAESMTLSFVNALHELERIRRRGFEGGADNVAEAG